MKTRSLAKLFAKRPRTVIFMFTLVTIVIALQARNIYIESDFSNYLPRDDPTLQLYDEINREFEIGSTIIILISQNGMRFDYVTDYEVLDEMDGIYDVLVRNPERYGEYTGIASVRSLSVLICEENSRDLPFGNNREDIPHDENLISTYMERPAIVGMEGILYTTDLHYAVIIVQLEDDADYDVVLSNVEDAVEKRGTKHVNMTITGTIAMQKAIQEKSMFNILFIFPVSLIFISIVLFYFHRTFKGIIIAFLPPAFAIALTFGTLGAISPELSVISVAIVSLLMGLGVDYSIHLMNRLSEEKTIEDMTLRIEKILRSTGKAVLLSTVTTFIGFGSLMISSMSPMVSFGFGCAIGILFCFISAIILVPCLVVILKFDRTGSIPSWKKFAKFTVNNRKRIILIAGFFAIMSLIVLPQIRTDVNYFDMAPSDIPELNAMFEYSDEFGNGGNFNAFMIETDSGGLENPAVVEAIYNMTEVMRARGVQVTTIADTLKEINDIFEINVIVEKLANITDADKIFYDKVFEQGLVNKDRSKTVAIVTVPIGISIEEIEELVNEVNSIASEYTNKNLIPENGHVSQLTGQDAINIVVNNKLKDEQIRSMIVALILVLAALILIFNSSVYGFLTMIPVCFILIWEPGFLVTFNIPLSLLTITIASIMIGIGIDYGIHITHRFREELANGKSKVDATITAIEKTGISLLEAALTTIAGISAILAINIAALNQFVIVVIFMVSVSCIGAALLLPAFYKSRFVK
jgi:hydrophobe/amphiphile efflux-3 (HAE3) family protein